MNQLPLIRTRASITEEVVLEISDPCNIPMNQGIVPFSGHKSNLTGD
jgi:hypothetical protein